jgi:predicted lipoprotein
MIIKIPVASVMLLAFTACPPPAPVEADAEAKRTVLTNVVNRVVIPSTEGFVTEAEALQTSLEAWQAARRTGLATTERDAAKAAFRTAFLRWQRLEMFAFGPAGTAPAFTLGLGLRDSVYAWPTINACRIDTVVADKLYASTSFFDTALVSSTGLATIEALLFSELTTNACAATASINANGTWAAISADELSLRRAEYASVAAAAVAKNARALRDAWKDGAAQKFSTAGLKDSGFTSASAGLDQVFAAMFEADLLLKDDRIGVPAGLVPSKCTSVPCPERAEAIPSGLSREAIVANIDALRALLHGDFDETGHGFDALLELRGASSLTADMDAALVDAKAKAQALNGPIDQAVVNQLSAVQVLHASVRDFTTLLKSQFVTVLSLQVPAEGAGDAD